MAHRLSDAPERIRDKKKSRLYNITPGNQIASQCELQRRHELERMVSIEQFVLSDVSIEAEHELGHVRLRD